MHVILLQVLVFESNRWGFTRPTNTQRLRLPQAQWSSGEEHLHLSLICSVGSVIQHWSKQTSLNFLSFLGFPLTFLQPYLHWGQYKLRGQWPALQVLDRYFMMMKILIFLWFLQPSSNHEIFLKGPLFNSGCLIQLPGQIPVCFSRKKTPFIPSPGARNSINLRQGLGTGSTWIDNDMCMSSVHHPSGGNTSENHRKPTMYDSWSPGKQHENLQIAIPISFVSYLLRYLQGMESILYEIHGIHKIKWYFYAANHACLLDSASKLQKFNNLYEQ